MFKFNFGNEKEVPERTICCGENDCRYRSKEVGIPANISVLVDKIFRSRIIKMNFNCGIEFSCLPFKEAMNMLKEKSDDEEFLDVLKADNQHSDLVPGKYEGGLKTWECTKDLAVYFMNHVVMKKPCQLDGKTVLDLGCGTGLLGIMCLSQNACVTFQDFNQEVLEAVTIPNIFLNCDESVREKIKLYNGDWCSFLELMLQKRRKCFNHVMQACQTCGSQGVIWQYYQNGKVYLIHKIINNYNSCQLLSPEIKETLPEMVYLQMYICLLYHV